MNSGNVEFEMELSGSTPASAEKPATVPTSAPSTGEKHRFEADLDIRDVDDRLRPGAPWAARSRELSRSHISFVARRMCYPGSMLGVAVHRIDESPVVLFGKVIECEYIGSGIHRTRVEFESLPDTAEADALRLMIRDGGQV